MLRRELQAAAGAAAPSLSRRLRQAASQGDTSAQRADGVALDPRTDSGVAAFDAASADSTATAAEGAVEPGDADEGPDMVDTGTIERAGDLFIAGTAAHADPAGAFRNQLVKHHCAWVSKAACGSSVAQYVVVCHAA